MYWRVYNRVQREMLKFWQSMRMYCLQCATVSSVRKESVGHFSELLNPRCELRILWNNECRKKRTEILKLLLCLDLGFVLCKFITNWWQLRGVQWWFSDMFVSQVFQTFPVSGSSCSAKSWRCFKPGALAEWQMDGCTDLSVLHQTEQWALEIRLNQQSSFF